MRALYLLTGVANLLSLDELGIKPFAGKDRYFETLRTLWNNMVDKKMYLTGGIGSMMQWEGFGIDYFLPQGSDEGGCYNETCASIGVMMLAERLLHIELNSKYADVMELCLYNAVMTASEWKLTLYHVLACALLGICMADVFNSSEPWCEYLDGA